MRRRSDVRCACAVAAALLAPPSPRRPRRRTGSEIKKPALKPFTPQQPERIALPNGIVHLPAGGPRAAARRAAPRASAAARAKSRPTRSGWSSSTARSGARAARRRAPATSSTTSSRRAARAVETGGEPRLDLRVVGLPEGETSTRCSPSSLDLLRNPDFREDKLALAKNQLNTGIARRNDDVGRHRRARGAQARLRRRLALRPRRRVRDRRRGDARRPAWPGTSTYVHPNNMILGVVGRLRRRTRWRRSCEGASAPGRKGPAGAEAESRRARAEARRLLRREGRRRTRANIRMVHLGIHRDNPDYFAVEVMNEVFGGGFSARLFSNIRSEEGPRLLGRRRRRRRLRPPGPLPALDGHQERARPRRRSTRSTRRSTTCSTTARRRPRSSTRAKESILNSFIFRFDSQAEDAGGADALRVLRLPARLPGALPRRDREGDRRRRGRAWRASTCTRTRSRCWSWARPRTSTSRSPASAR